MKPRQILASRLFAFVLLAFALIVTHWHLLRLPYFWDEAGHYVPAARDLLLAGGLIPHSVPSNAHPPLVMAWLALAWKIFGYSPLVARIAMLFIAAFGLLAAFELAREVANRQVAIATPPALPLVRLSLSEDRIHLRQSRFLPLQRGGDVATSAHCTGYTAPGLAARGTHESVCAYAGYGVGDALSAAA